MHELSLCQSIYKIAQRSANGRCVREIGLTIGELRQVVPDTLVFCWDTTTRRTALAGSRLAVTYLPGVLECRDCAARTEMEGELSYHCGACASSAVTVTQGNEFTLTYIDVSDA